MSEYYIECGFNEDDELCQRLFPYRMWGFGFGINPNDKNQIHIFSEDDESYHYKMSIDKTVFDFLVKQAIDCLSNILNHKKFVVAVRRFKPIVYEFENKKIKFLIRDYVRKDNDMFHMFIDEDLINYISATKRELTKLKEIFEKYVMGVRI